MNEFVIKTENLSKAYRLGLKEKKNETLIGTLWDLMTSPVKNFRNIYKLGKLNIKNQEDNLLWALKNINLEVKEGEVLGIIGKNGAGKSTLLKILSRITHPTTGRFITRGRIGALLEVGTGMHPELTGRENIYLNGTILGMSKAEIDRKFDEIVEFAGVERFIDTPVKRYSSGMRVRLGFAIAAHLETEILIVDEVLAVGDAAFQKKSLGKMESAAKSGRTVLFVSHNMGAIESLCSRAIMLKNGQLVKDGNPDEVIRFYLSDIQNNTQKVSRSLKNTDIYIKDVYICGDEKCTTNIIPFGSNLTIQVKIHVENIKFRPWIGIRIADLMGTKIAYLPNIELGHNFPPMDSTFLVKLHIHSINLIPDTYKVGVRLAEYTGKVIEEIENAGTFTIYPAGYATKLNRRFGFVTFPTQWEIEKIGE